MPVGWTDGDDGCSEAADEGEHMTTEDDSSRGADAEAGGVNAEEAKAAASSIVEVMKAALEAAVEAAPRPVWALAGLLLAVRSLRTALPTVTPLTEDDISEAMDFVRATYVGEAKGACVAVASSIINARCAHAHPEQEDYEAVVHEAASCIDMFQRGSTVNHPVTMLVVLYAARQIAFALLKHEHPDEYERMCLVAKAMENAVKPKAIGIVSVPTNTHFTKGGDA